MEKSLVKNLVIFPYNTSAKQTSSKLYTVLRKFSKNIFKRFHCVLLASSKDDPLKINFETYERYPLEDFFLPNLKC